MTIDAPPATPPPAAPSRGNRAMRSAVEWVVIIAAALLVAFIVKTFLIQAFYIPSASMEPTLDIRDRILVNKLSYRLHDIHRGDIVVFERPDCAVRDPAIKDLVKRVVGLPGDTVEGRNGGVLVNGHRLVEDYLPGGQSTSDFGPVEVPQGKLWMMGDNRENSSDSRVLCGGPTYIDQQAVVGRAFVRVFPVTRLGLL
ncbi:MAG TPA: signal peptidase I [Acidimicrobiales bacterium]|nr:signal peptidase I [Acidimicrobiales bacterium]